MNVIDLEVFQNESTWPVQKLYEKTGSCKMNGYLGEDLKDPYLDENGLFCFSTHKEVEDTVIDSFGTAYKDSVLIKQTSKSYTGTDYSLYSWDASQGKYTFLGFDDPNALDRFYDRIRKFGINLCDEDVTLLFREMGLTLENVTNILLNQERNPMDMMFDDEFSGGDGQFVL